MTLPKPDRTWLIPIFTVLAGLGIYLIDPPPVHELRNNVFDQYQRWQPRTYQDAPVRIVDIDEASLAKLGQWPWSRIRIADLVDKLQSVGAAAIVFDVIFAEPDRTSPKEMLKVWHPSSELARYISALPDPDQVFAKTIAKGRVVLGHALLRTGTPPRHFAEPFRVIQIGDSPLPYFSPFQGAVTALPELEDAAAGNGAVSFIPDSDGVVRKVPMLLRLGDQVVPSLVTEALRVGQGAHNILVKTDPEHGTGISSIRVGRIEIPTTGDGQIWVHYTRPEASRYIPAWKVLGGQEPADELRGRILLIGSSAQGLMDLRFSPLGGIIPGVESHAQALEQILLGDHLVRPNWAPGLETLGIVVGGLLVGFIGLYSGARLSALASLLMLMLTGYGSWYAYTQHQMLLDPVTPGLILLMVFIITSLYHHLRTEKQQRWVREAFSHYVSPNLVNHLIEHPEQLELGGNRRQCSFIFTDLAGFTNLMEKLDPVEAVSLLNNYLDNMIKVAFQHEGTLDRIVGDAVAIMFSAPLEQPDHRQRALDCAIAMHHYAQRHAAEANARGIPFGATRIGIHTGEVTVGNFGGSTIFDYRALGDPVNTASRLESVNKQLGTLVCVSEATLEGCQGIVVRPVGRLVLKGKTQPLMVYQPLLGEEGEQMRPDPDYEAAYRQMAESDPAAMASFEKLLAERPDDPLVKLHCKRLHEGQTGEVIVFTEK